MYDVSIIVPIYDVENFIEKCATTLFSQDYKNIEYIFVNDATPDNSMEVLQNVINKFPNRKDDIKIINKPKNEGSGKSKKTGLENATGEYILYIDSDDWVEFDMVSSLIKKAKDENADIVYCNYFVNYRGREIYKKQNYKNIKQKDVLKNLLSDVAMLGLPIKFYRKSLFDNIEFLNFKTGNGE